MSNRRGRGGPANRPAARARRPTGPPGRSGAPRSAGSGAGPPGWLTARWPAVALALAAEVGHLVAGYLEWPTATAAGVGHIVLAGLLGLSAVVVLYGSHPLRLLAASAAALMGPLWWLAGSMLAAAAYRELPTPVAAGITAVEVVLAVGLLAAAWTTTTPPATRGAVQTSSR